MRKRPEGGPESEKKRKKTQETLYLKGRGRGYGALGKIREKLHKLESCLDTPKKPGSLPWLWRKGDLIKHSYLLRTEEADR